MTNSGSPQTRRLHSPVRPQVVIAGLRINRSETQSPSTKDGVEVFAVRPHTVAADVVSALTRITPDECGSALANRTPAPLFALTQNQINGRF